MWRAGDPACPPPSTPRTHLTSLARVLSIAGHPFLLAPITVAAVTSGWRWTAIVAATTVVPMLAIIVRNVRRGAWSDADVSRRDQRLGFYAAAAPLTLFCAAALYFFDAEPRLLRGVAAGAAMLGAGVLAHRYLKISVHMMFAAFCAVTIIRSYPSSTVTVVPFVAAIGWSRQALGRHTWPEVAAGTALGAAAAAVAMM